MSNAIISKFLSKINKQNILAILGKETSKAKSYSEVWNKKFIFLKKIFF